jgi:inner membrane protein
VRQKGPQGWLAATVALLGIVALWGLRDYEHRRAVSAMQARTYQGADALHLSAYPNYWNPFRWYGVAESQDFFAQMVVNSTIPEVDPQGLMRIRYKPEETPVTLAAKNTFLGHVYLDWAKYPITETEELGTEGYVVHFRDLRYDYPGRGGRNPLGASVALDRNLHVIREYFGAPTSIAPHND